MKWSNKSRKVQRNTTAIRQRFFYRSPKLLVRIWCLHTWLRTNAVYYKTLYGNLLYPWIFFRNKTCKTILFHLLVQCLLLLLHVESWAVSSINERVIESGRWGEVEEIGGRKLSWFTGKTHHTLSADDRQTDQKTIHSLNTGEKATTFQSFSSAIYSRVDQPWHQRSCFLISGSRHCQGLIETTLR